MYDDIRGQNVSLEKGIINKNKKGQTVSFLLVTNDNANDYLRDISNINPKPTR